MSPSRALNTVTRCLAVRYSWRTRSTLNLEHISGGYKINIQGFLEAIAKCSRKTDSQLGSVRLTTSRRIKKREEANKKHKRNSFQIVKCSGAVRVVDKVFFCSSRNANLLLFISIMKSRSEFASRKMGTGDCDSISSTNHWGIRTREKVFFLLCVAAVNVKNVSRWVVEGCEPATPKVLDPLQLFTQGESKPIKARE